MSRRLPSLFLVLGATIATPAAARDVKAWDHASSISRDTLIAVALGLPTVKGDWNGALQAGGSVGAAYLVTTGLKETFPELRPDGSDRKSFPSGHTSTAFAAAASLPEPLGWSASRATRRSVRRGIARRSAQASLVRRRRRSRDRRGLRLLDYLTSRWRCPRAPVGRH